MRRIFIAINLPDALKEKLILFKKRWYFLPAKWVKKENLHLTLLFLGYLRDEKLPKIFEISQEVAQRHKKFSLCLQKVILAPKQDKIPRMIWVELERSENLQNLQSDLENSLILAKIPFQKETRQFSPHLTLCRIRKWEFKQMDPEEIPEINEKIDFSFSVNSFEVMESKLKRQGPEYLALKSFSLKE